MGGRGEERGIEVLHEEGGERERESGKEKSKKKGEKCKRERREDGKRKSVRLTQTDGESVRQTERECAW